MDDKKPKIDLPLSPLDKAIEIISIIGVVGIFYYLWFMWHGIPSVVATHFDAMGKPDSTGGKGSLFILPVVSAFMYALLTITARFPQSFNLPKPVTEKNAEYMYKNARLMMAFLKLEIIIMFDYIEYCTIQSAINGMLGLSEWFVFVSLGVLFASIGYFIVKMLREP